MKFAVPPYLPQRRAWGRPGVLRGRVGGALTKPNLINRKLNKLQSAKDRTWGREVQELCCQVTRAWGANTSTNSDAKQKFKHEHETTYKKKNLEANTNTDTNTDENGHIMKAERNSNTNEDIKPKTKKVPTTNKDMKINTGTRTNSKTHKQRYIYQMNRREPQSW